jgi:hypothetical protein
MIGLVIRVLLEMVPEHRSAERSASDTAVKHFSLFRLASLPGYAFRQAKLLELDLFSACAIASSGAEGVPRKCSFQARSSFFLPAVSRV